jgi:hypothetical protein
VLSRRFRHQPSQCQRVEIRVRTETQEPVEPLPSRVWQGCVCNSAGPLYTMQACTGFPRGVQIRCNANCMGRKSSIHLS